MVTSPAKAPLAAQSSWVPVLQPITIQTIELVGEKRAELLQAVFRESARACSELERVVHHEFGHVRGLSSTRAQWLRFKW